MGKFDLDVVIPQKLVLHVCNQTKCKVSVAKLAWAILNDTTVEPFCNMYSPTVLACAAVQLSSILLLNDNLPKAWYNRFGLSRHQLSQVLDRFVQFYQERRGRGSLGGSDVL